MLFQNSRYIASWRSQSSKKAGNKWKRFHEAPGALKSTKNLGYMGYFAEKGRSESNQIYSEASVGAGEQPSGQSWTVQEEAKCRAAQPARGQ